MVAWWGLHSLAAFYLGGHVTLATPFFENFKGHVWTVHGNMLVIF